MSGTQQLNECIDKCQQVIKELQSLSNMSNNNTELKSTLNESAHHLQMCMHECQFASQQAP